MSIEKRTGIEVHGLVKRMERMGWIRLSWREILDSNDHRQTVGGMVSDSSQALKSAGAENPLDLLAAEAISQWGVAPPPGGAKARDGLQYALTTILVELQGLAWGYKNFGGRAEKVEDSELTPFEARHGLNSPRKWRKYTGDQLKWYGFRVGR